MLAWCLAILFAAWVASTLFWRFTAPVTPSSTPHLEYDPRKGARDIVHAFGGIQRHSAPLGTSTSATQDYQLLGLATGFGGLPAFALIRGEDGHSWPLQVGEAFPDGMRLVAIHPDHIELSGTQGRRILRLPHPAAALPTAQTAGMHVKNAPHDD